MHLNSSPLSVSLMQGCTPHGDSLHVKFKKGLGVELANVGLVVGRIVVTNLLLEGEDIGLEVGRIVVTNLLLEGEDCVTEILILDESQKLEIVFIDVEIRCWH